MASAQTYTPIATQTLATGASSVTFSSIPQTYTDLILATSIEASSSGQGLTMQVGNNNTIDTGSTYSNTILRADGSTASSARQSNNNQFLLANIGGPSTTNFGVYNAHFMNYANTTTYKTVLVRSNNAANGVDAMVDLWRATNAINIITILISGGTMTAGSTFTLYGIAAA
jgi:hypothetical protein